METQSSYEIGTGKRRPKIYITVELKNPDPNKESFTCSYTGPRKGTEREIEILTQELVLRLQATQNHQLPPQTGESITITHNPTNEEIPIKYKKE